MNITLKQAIENVTRWIQNEFGGLNFNPADKQAQAILMLSQSTLQLLIIIEQLHPDALAGDLPLDPLAAFTSPEFVEDVMMATPAAPAPESPAPDPAPSSDESPAPEGDSGEPEAPPADQEPPSPGSQDR